jgi:hypothetical protein
LASAFEVLTFLTTFLFLFLFESVTDYFVQSSGLIGQSQQATTADSDRGPILEPIQEVPVDDILVKSSEQPETKTIGNLGDDIFTSSFEQFDTHMTDVLDALANQPRHSSNQANLPAEQATEV